MSQTKKPSLRLTMADRDDVRYAIREPLQKAALDKRTAARLEASARVFQAMFSEEEHAAIKALASRLARPDTVDVKSDAPLKEGQNWPQSYRLYFKGAQAFPYPQAGFSAPQAELDALDAIDAEYEAEGDRIKGLIAELNGVLLSSSTRAALARAWPAVYDLMGKQWVEASKEPNTLPAVMTANITAAVLQLKQAA